MNSVDDVDESFMIGKGAEGDAGEGADESCTGSGEGTDES